MPTNIVAVYGTLRESLNDHKLIADQKRMGLGWLTGFKMYNLGELPGVLAAHNLNSCIRVEWYNVSNEVLEEMDRFQGFNPDSEDASQYLRKPVFSPYGRGWIYLYNQPLNNASYMEAGDWKRYIRDTAHHLDAQAV